MQRSINLFAANDSLKLGLSHINVFGSSGSKSMIFDIGIFDFGRFVQTEMGLDCLIHDILNVYRLVFIGNHLAFVLETQSKSS